MKKDLSINLYKNNNLRLTKESIPYLKDGNTYTFELEGANTSITIEQTFVELIRDTEEYTFKIQIGENNTCNYLLKELNSNLNIHVDDGEFLKEENKITIYYQIETDDEFTTLELIWR